MLCRSQMLFPFKGMVTLLDILRAYAEAYVKGAKTMAMLNVQIFYNAQASGYDVRNDFQLLNRLNMHLSDLLGHCQPHLPMTAAAVLRLRATINDAELMSTWQSADTVLQTMITEVLTRLEDELSLNLFFKLPEEKRKYFEQWGDGWEKILARFPDMVRDVEEMNKCFALSRYTAAMFHALHVAEWGAIQLGDYIGVTDPKKGWGPTERRLQELIRGGHTNLPSSLAGAFDFLEQINREIDSMVLAWRHKVDHAANHLAILPNIDFTQDVAEHVISAVRIFMLRLMDGISAEKKLGG
ncbi:MAG: hypothetical protein P4N59_15375 [Negativicutes bacterium]|nr:hypothetical protein [Negativicutes bacterium]